MPFCRTCEISQVNEIGRRRRHLAVIHIFCWSFFKAFFFKNISSIYPPFSFLKWAFTLQLCFQNNMLALHCKSKTAISIPRCTGIKFQIVFPNHSAPFLLPILFKCSFMRKLSSTYSSFFEFMYFHLLLEIDLHDQLDNLLKIAPHLL